MDPGDLEVGQVHVGRAKDPVTRPSLAMPVIRYFASSDAGYGTSAPFDCVPEDVVEGVHWREVLLAEVHRHCLGRTERVGGIELGWWDGLGQGVVRSQRTVAAHQRVAPVLGCQADPIRPVGIGRRVGLLLMQRPCVGPKLAWT